MSFSVNCLPWTRLLLAAVLLVATTAHAQQPAGNDGFRRRNGQMEVIRNGQPYPMTRDAHLPTGATVTKDGFVASATGQRIELREGQGCDLRGRPVAVLAAPNGALALAGPGAVAGPARVAPTTLLKQVFGRSNEEEGEGFFNFKKAKKHHGKGKGKGKGHWKDD